MGYYDDGFPIIKFVVVSVILIGLILVVTPDSVSWKLKIAFLVAVPIGVGLALAGKGAKGFTPLSRI